MKNKQVFLPHIPKTKIRDDFPFTFNITEIEPVNNVDIELQHIQTNDRNNSIKQKLKTSIISKFDFNKYANKNSEYYNKCEDEYIAKISVFSVKKEKNKNVSTLIKEFFLKINNIKTTYSFVLVDSLELLKESLKDVKKIAFDTETTGLNPEDDYLVGISTSTKPREGYYIPINHAEEFSNYNLGKEAIDIVYEALTKSELTYMFNARFDMRFLEYSDSKYDMSKVNVIDTQVNYYLADPDSRLDSLKELETHILGITRPNLKETLQSAKLNDFNFSKLDPKVALFYAAQDAISTFELGEETMQYLYETSASGQIDQALIYPLMKMENSGIHINIDYLEKQLKNITTRLVELDELIKKSIGDINLNSSQQKAKLFESFGLDTGIRTNTGQMSTGRDAVDDMILKLKKTGADYPEWLEYLGEYSTLEKLNNTFFGPLYEQAKLYDDNKVRLNYRNTSTATGRLSSGKENVF